MTNYGTKTIMHLTNPERQANIFVPYPVKCEYIALKSKLRTRGTLSRFMELTILFLKSKEKDFQKFCDMRTFSKDEEIEAEVLK